MPNGNGTEEKIRRLRAAWRTLLRKNPELRTTFPKEPWDAMGNWQPGMKRRVLDAVQATSQAEAPISPAQLPIGPVPTPLPTVVPKLAPMPPPGFMPTPTPTPMPTPMPTPTPAPAPTPAGSPGFLPEWLTRAASMAWKAIPATSPVKPTWEAAKAATPALNVLHQKGQIPFASEAFRLLPIAHKEGRTSLSFDQFLKSEGGIDPRVVLGKDIIPRMPSLLHPTAPIANVLGAGLRGVIAENLNLPMAGAPPGTKQADRVTAEAQRRYGRLPSEAEKRKIREDLYKYPPFVRGALEELPTAFLPAAGTARAGIKGTSLASKAMRETLYPLELVEKGIARGVKAAVRPVARGLGAGETPRRILRQAEQPFAPTTPARAAVDTVFHGTRGGRLESFIDTDGNLVLQPSANFEGRTVGVSFTRDRATSIDYATRFSAGEGGGAIAARRQRGGFIFEIDRDAIPDTLFVESAEEIATRGTNPVVIPKGRFKVSSVDEEAQAALRAFETEGRASARALSDRELGERSLRSDIEGELAEARAGGEYSGWFPYKGLELTQEQLDIADRFGFEAVGNPVAPWIGPEIRRRMKGKSPDELTALFKGLAKGAEDLSPHDRNAPFFYGPDFETHFRKAYGADVPITPTTPVTPAPAGAIPTGARPGREVSEDILPDVDDFGETVVNMSRPNVMRKVANLPVIRSIQARFNPAAVPKDEVDLAFRTRDILRAEVDSLTQSNMDHLGALGSQDQIFGKLGPTGLIAEGPLQGLTVNTIRTYPKRYATRTTPEMKEWIRRAADVEKAKLNYLKANGIKIQELTFDEGGQYAGRRVWALQTSEGEVLNVGYVSRFGKKLPQEKERIFETAEEAIEAGYRYLPEDVALALNVQGAYYRVIDQRMQNWLLDRIPWRTTAIPDVLKAAQISAQQRLALARRAPEVLQRARRGETLPTGTVNAIERLFPQLEGRLREPTRVRIKDVLKAAKTLSEPERAFEAPHPWQISNAKKRVDEAQKLFDLDPDNPQLLIDLKKRRGEWGFLKKRYRVFEETGKPLTIPHNVAKALRQDAIKDLDELLEAIRGTLVTRPNKRPRYEGGLIADIRNETFQIAKKTAEARKRAGKTTLVEARVAHPSFAGKILTGKEAKEIAIRIDSALGPQVGFEALTRINAVQAVSRFLNLGGDFSNITIQLILLAGRPGIMGKAIGGFVESLRSPTWVSRYMDLPENAAIIRKYPGLKRTTGGTTEVTEATGRGGLLEKGQTLFPEGEARAKTAALLPFRAYLKGAGVFLRPAARGYEGSMDVAGVELIKSLDYLGTTASRRYDLAQFVNKFRGVTSSARLGVSKKHRQAETLVALAPMYNRAIASLLADLFQGGLSGSLARKGVARGVTGVAAFSVAFSLARGESLEEATSHLMPWKDGKVNPEFLTWEIAGQRIGPGSKVRSLIMLFARSYTNPEDLKLLPFYDLEYMRNPIIKFGRGLASPIGSLGWDLLTGKDYIEDPTRDGVLQLTETVAKRHMPIWVASVTFEGGTPIERVTRGSAEIAGLRGYPTPLYGRKENLENRMVEQAIQINPEGATQQNILPGISYKGLSEVQKNWVIGQEFNQALVEEHADLTAEEERRKARRGPVGRWRTKGEWWDKWHSRRIAYHKELTDWAEQAEGLPGGDAWFRAKVAKVSSDFWVGETQEIEAGKDEFGDAFMETDVPKDATPQLLMERDIEMLLNTDDPETYEKYFPGEEIISIRAKGEFNGFEYTRRKKTLNEAAAQAGLDPRSVEVLREATLSRRVREGAPEKYRQMVSDKDYIAEHYWSLSTSPSILNIFPTEDVKIAWQTYSARAKEDRALEDADPKSHAHSSNKYQVADPVHLRRLTFKQIYDSEVGALREEARRRDPELQEKLARWGYVVSGPPAFGHSPWTQLQ